MSAVVVVGGVVLEGVIEFVGEVLMQFVVVIGVVCLLFALMQFVVVIGVVCLLFVGGVVFAIVFVVVVLGVFVVGSGVVCTGVVGVGVVFAFVVDGDAMLLAKFFVQYARAKACLRLFVQDVCLVRLGLELGWRPVLFWFPGQNIG